MRVECLPRPSVRPLALEDTAHSRSGFPHGPRSLRVWVQGITVDTLLDFQSIAPRVPQRRDPLNILLFDI